ncbi:MAG TPA: SGNH/GDSL hydrolase family protein [Roseiflexaceae bacterium]|nr:SGNH/GDSL hydrolase family protein [Roseiflexaceae bacterium]
MPLGDSITDGYNIPGGYRIKLWQDLVARNPSINFVGSTSNGPSSLGDRQHEGHSGWRIDQIDANIVAWLNASQPDIVLLLIGTNDVLQQYQLSSAPARLSELIDTITSTSPATHVIVASIPPLENGDRNGRAQTYNSAIPAIVADKIAAGQSVSYVNAYSALTPADLADGVHPNQAGYDKLAAVWYHALLGHTPAASSTSTPTSTHAPTPTVPHTPMPTVTLVATPTVGRTPAWTVMLPNIIAAAPAR